MASVMASLPLHLLCQLIGSGSPVANTINIAANISEQQVQHTTTTIPDGFKINVHNNRAYRISNDSRMWTQARERCTELGARLAVIDSWTKLNIIWNQDTAAPRSYHVGIYRMDGVWVDINTGITLKHLPWLANYPQSNNEDNKNNCGMLQIYNASGLFHFSCGYSTNYICEVSVPANFATENQVVEISAN